MTDIRESLVSHLERVGVGYGLHDGLKREVLGAWADAILAAGWTPPGERVKPSVEVGVCEHQNANYLRMMSERDALRAEVERLRAVSATQPYETERELAVALDEARRELADLRAGIEALLPGETVNVYAGGGNLVSQRRVVDPDHLRTLLAESGEQPGERDATPDEAHDIGYAKGHTDGYREALAEHPAPVVPDSTDARGELLHVLDSHGIDTYIDGTGAEVGVQNLITDILAVVGQGVAEEIERLRDALTDDPDRAALELIVEDAARIARGVGS